MLIIVANAVAVSVVVGAVYLVSALIQVKKTAIELESAMRKLSTKLDIVSKVSDKVVSIKEKLASPVVSAFSLLFHIVSSINKRRKTDVWGK
ncbi:MAG: hypothetical protein LE180_01850 [Endomicrobium sp.]|uniref:hypothetical protein n=1 Tax=Candidatus Endomicrobiellum pyrsonymphae TaxID=1408203 RepID=UPI003572004B|nr:hypothetical protein [Endomicrobium sp.]